MCSCWCLKPKSRPLFDSLGESIGRLLKNEVAEQYIELNRIFSSKLSNQVGYLASITAPMKPKTNTLKGYVPMNTIKNNPLSRNANNNCDRS